MGEHEPNPDYYLQYARRKGEDSRAEREQVQEHIPDFDHYLEHSRQRVAGREAELDAAEREREGAEARQRHQKRLTIEAREALKVETTAIARLARDAQVPQNVTTGFLARSLRGWLLYEDITSGNSDMYIPPPDSYTYIVLTHNGALQYSGRMSKNSAEGTVHLYKLMDFYDHYTERGDYESCRMSLARFAIENGLIAPKE